MVFYLRWKNVNIIQNPQKNAEKKEIGQKDVIIINGTVITLNKLIIAVKDIERATSPLAKEVNIFDVTPPGAAAIIITPIANSGEIGQILIKINAIIGSKIIWLIAPTRKSLGCFKTLKKSAPVKPKPSANIIKAKAKGRKISVIMPIYYSISLWIKLF